MKIKKSYFFAVGASILLVVGVFFNIKTDIPEKAYAADLTVPEFSSQSGCYDSEFSLKISVRAGDKVYYTTDGSIPEVSSGGSANKETHEYTGQILVKNRQGEKNILCSVENIDLMYDPQYRIPFYPQKEDVAKATVIRAISVDKEGSKSAVVTKTYFVGNDIYNRYKNASVISIVTDPDHLLSEETGIYRVGNYNNKGAEWERPAFVEYFEGDGNIPFATEMGIRMHGGYSRNWGQKSFRLHFREELGGLKNLSNYELIPGATNFDKTNPTKKYKNFILRNGGNDTEYTKLQDVFIQDLVKDRAFTIQSGRPCVLFLNGEYWGLYTLTERYSDNYLEEEFGVDKDNVIMFENEELDVGEESDVSEFQNLRAQADKDMTDAENYKSFCDMVDIQSFADYYAVQAYIGNNDWPDNNVRLWRTKEVEEGNKYADKKWRWMLYDTEFSMNLYQSTGNNFDGIWKAREDGLFEAVIKNETFQKLFVNTMMDLYNVNFDLDKAKARLDQFVNVYRPLMNDYFKRFDGSSDWHFDSNIGRMKFFMEARREKNNLRQHLKYHFNTGNETAVTITSSISVKEQIRVNTTCPDMESGSWTGIYFQKYPIKVKAVVPKGYQFDGWIVTGGNVDDASSQEATVTFNSSSATIRAKYKEAPASLSTPSPAPAPTPRATQRPTKVPTPIPTGGTGTANNTKNKITVKKSVILSLSNKTKRVLKLKIKKISGVKGYQVVYASDMKFKKSKKMLTTKKVNLTIKKLKSKKVYYFKTRAYKTDSKGKKVYGKYSTVKKKRVK